MERDRVEIVALMAVTTVVSVVAAVVVVRAIAKHPVKVISRLPFASTPFFGFMR